MFHWKTMRTRKAKGNSHPDTATWQEASNVSNAHPVLLACVPNGNAARSLGEPLGTFPIFQYESSLRLLDGHRRAVFAVSLTESNLLYEPSDAPLGCAPSRPNEYAGWYFWIGGYPPVVDAGATCRPIGFGVQGAASNKMREVGSPLGYTQKPGKSSFTTGKGGKVCVLYCSEYCNIVTQKGNTTGIEEISCALRPCLYQDNKLALEQPKPSSDMQLP